MTPHRGEVYDVRFPSGRRPAVVVTRERVIPYLTSVTVVQVTSTIRGLPTEVPLGREHGVDHELSLIHITEPTILALIS